MVKSQASPENREGECSFIKERGNWSCYKQRVVHWRKLNSKCTGVSLAGLLQGEEKIFLSLLGSRVENTFQLER